ncbi:MAG TPA: tetratricopeptide repeat protein [Terriglobales bacterium]|nr:tetratricopeptide repeat protein [Terriglobales bacterium]
MKTILWVVCVALFVPAALADEGHQGHELTAEQLGTVSFPTSCAPAVQKQMERGVALLHSFWYGEAERTFAAAQKQDAKCAMALWGQAMSLWHPLWDPPEKESLKRGLALVEKAEKMAATPREQAYIAALKTFYRGWETKDFHTRAVAYEQAMAEMHQQHPEDREAAIFYALSLLATADPKDKTYANQQKAGRILNELLPGMPNHPGIAHYLIHSFDHPGIAEQGLAAARRYAAIAPASAHARHMPSHIFTRLGLWQESEASNLSAIEAAEAAMAQGKQGLSDKLHAMDYAAYASLQCGEEQQAARLAKEAEAIAKNQKEWSGRRGAFGYALTGSRYVLERRQWSEAAALWVPQNASAEAQALVHWTRTVGAARSGDAEMARKELAKLRAAVRGIGGDTSGYGWHPGDLEVETARAWVAQAEGKAAEAEQRMRRAADREDDGELGAIAYPPIVPAREMLADLLLEQQRPAHALAEYEAVLKDSPDRFNALYGAARAAESAGKSETAAEYYARLLRVSGGEQATRPEVARAKSAVKGD